MTVTELKEQLQEIEDAGYGDLEISLSEGWDYDNHCMSTSCTSVRVVMEDFASDRMVVSLD